MFLGELCNMFLYCIGFVCFVLFCFVCLLLGFVTVHIEDNKNVLEKNEIFYLHYTSDTTPQLKGKQKQVRLGGFKGSEVLAAMDNNPDGKKLSNEKLKKKWNDALKDSNGIKMNAAKFIFPDHIESAKQQQIRVILSDEQEELASKVEKRLVCFYLFVCFLHIDPKTAWNGSILYVFYLLFCLFRCLFFTYRSKNSLEWINFVCVLFAFLFVSLFVS